MPGGVGMPAENAPAGNGSWAGHGMPPSFRLSKFTWAGVLLLHWEPNAKLLLGWGSSPRLSGRHATICSLGGNASSFIHKEMRSMVANLV